MEAAVQDRAGLDGGKWSVDYVPLGVTRYKKLSHI